jgi:hypothetical protein
MSSRCRLARLLTVLFIGVEMAEDDTGQAAFEAAQGFGRGVTDGDAMTVIGLPDSIETDLGDCDPV